LILYAVTQPQSWLAATMRLGWFRWLGSIAYGAYLVHQMVAKFVFKLIWHSSDPHPHSLANAGAMTLAPLLTLAVSRLSWTYFEKPLLLLGHRFRYDAKRRNSLGIETEGENNETQRKQDTIAIHHTQS
jgi:peptidoglycan/LPS O-acetylase OafA/YrhL